MHTNELFDSRSFIVNRKIYSNSSIPDTLNDTDPWPNRDMTGPYRNMIGPYRNMTGPYRNMTGPYRYTTGSQPFLKIIGTFASFYQYRDRDNFDFFKNKSDRYRDRDFDLYRELLYTKDHGWKSSFVPTGYEWPKFLNIFDKRNKLNYYPFDADIFL